ncbi:hypothetical protein CV102_00720 [Natronococcus pandeyae]|uniref:Uncharacterized protein n=1 Tax=Natronococcus pandeyae TaxID=2055836 RepID=A0A8J8Q7A4_9EURY|nr:hypothetical protein [Natronococcus pandeyae]TYL40137.1 hypothetical protein CV102_00720 [Natronococcus pandeyae]
MTQTSADETTTVAQRRDLANALEVDVSGDEPVTWDGLAGRVESTSDPAFASIGEEIRADLAGQLDAALLEDVLDGLERELRRLPEVRAVGVPDEPGGNYVAVAEPGWRLYDHLLEINFFERLDETMPRFTAEHVERTTRELVGTESLSSALEEIGFDETEKTALLVAVATNNERLARWVPANQIPDGVEFDTSKVPPLHQRAMGGALLWIRGLDRHLWQYEPLVTEAILDDAAWYTKAMLGGIYVTALAAHDLATAESFSDETVTAAFTGSAAIQIVSQEDLMRDVFYITDEMRAPSKLR